jgi:hypothetical protein
MVHTGATLQSYSKVLTKEMAFHSHSVASSDQPPHSSDRLLARGRASTFEKLVGSFVSRYELQGLKSQAPTPIKSAHDTPSSSSSKSSLPTTQSTVHRSKIHRDHRTTTEVIIPDLTEVTDKLKARLYLVQLSTLLTHCQVLQTIANKFEHQALTKADGKSAHAYYTKMESQACRARTIAKKLQSKEYQARCEYWAGRAHGGMHNFQRAMDHMRLAMDLDVHGHGSQREETQPRGLTWEEKSDVRSLLASATKRHQMRLEKADGNAALLIAEIEAERTGRALEECVEWDPNSPAWRPNQDYVVHKAKRDFADQGKSRNKGKAIGVEPTGDTRKTLSDEEWWFIRHGNVPFRRTVRRKMHDRAARKVPSQSSEASAPDLTSGSSVESGSESERESESGEAEEVCSPLPGKLCSLAQELEGMDDWDENTPPVSASLLSEVMEGDDGDLAPVEEEEEENIPMIEKEEEKISTIEEREEEEEEKTSTEGPNTPL